MIGRGSIHLVDFEPARGGTGVNKVRPGVIVSNDSANRAASRHGQGVVTVCPITSHVARLLPFQVHLPADVSTGLKANSKIQVEQLSAIDVRYVGVRAGELSPEQMRALDGALRLHLSL